jgi:hypothetical protein
VGLLNLPAYQYTERLKLQLPITQTDFRNLTRFQQDQRVYQNNLIQIGNAHALSYFTVKKLWVKNLKIQ